MSNGTAQHKMGEGRQLVPCERSDRIRLVSVCFADVQSDSWLSSSKAAHFSKVSCVSEVFTQTLMLPAEHAAVFPTQQPLEIFAAY